MARCTKVLEGPPDSTCLLQTDYTIEGSLFLIVRDGIHGRKGLVFRAFRASCPHSPIPSAHILSLCYFSRYEFYPDRRSDSLSHPSRVGLRIHVGPDSAPAKVSIISFGDVIHDKEDVEDCLRRAQLAIFSPGTRRSSWATLMKSLLTSPFHLTASSLRLPVLILKTSCSLTCQVG